MAAVRDLTGVPIDYFAEINLAGFYDLASSLGGIEVCLNHATDSEVTPAPISPPAAKPSTRAAGLGVRTAAPRPGQRRPGPHTPPAGLPCVGDAEAPVVGTFTDLGKLNALIAIAHKDIVLSTGWNDALFRRIGEITGADVEYQTLPVLRYDTVDGEDVNIVDPAAIKAQVTAAFNGSTSSTASTEASSSTPSSTVDVINAGSTSGLANTISDELTQRGYTEGEVRNPLTGEPRETGIDYGSGASTDAQNLATLLGIDVSPRLDSSQEPGHIRVTLGSDYSLPPSFGTSDAATATGTVMSANSAGSDSSDPTSTPDQGQPVVGNDIPCVN